MKPFNQNANKDMGKTRGLDAATQLTQWLTVNSMATYTYCFYTPKLYWNFSFKNNMKCFHVAL